MGWVVVGRTRCWVLGEQAPAALFSCPARAVLTVWWVFVCGGLRVGGVGGVCASVAGPAFLCLPVGGCGGGGVWLWIMGFS